MAADSVPPCKQPWVGRLRAEEGPKWSRGLAVFGLALLLVLMGLSAARAGQVDPPEKAENAWLFGLKVKRFFKSHTSYEFGNPYPPGQVPLSRLEFPLDSWWAGVELRRDFPRWSFGLEALRNLSREALKRAKDSDWDDDHATGIKTIYSESDCRLEPSYMVRADVDLKVSDWLGLPPWLDLRPVMGVRWQRFEFVDHDGTQYYPAPGDPTPPTPLPGDGIRFKQTYWQYFLGVRAACDLQNSPDLPLVKLLMQVDWAYVEGHNQDHHLLREGSRFTYEDTIGDAWHASLGMRVGIWQNLSAGLELEHMLIHTTGSHRLENRPFGIDFIVNNGVTVWSEQTSLMLSLEYRF
jgi:hypothetical protein